VRAFLLPTTLILFSCGVPIPREKTENPDERFTGLWRLYTHCQTSPEVDSVVLDAVYLSKAAPTTAVSLPKLFESLEPFVPPSPVRVASDPKAMAAAWTLRAAQLARRAGRPDLAIALYQSMPTYASGHEYD
jgi:hypothetical protein